MSLALLVAAGLGVCRPAQQSGSKASKPSSSPAANGKSFSAGGKTGSSKSKKSGKKTNAKSRRDKGQKAPTPERISAIQQALGKNGSFQGAPNGKWDDSTVDAMKKFQASHGLNPSGRLDAHTLQQLGLGSQTAGVAAPLPPTSSSSPRTIPKSMARGYNASQTAEPQ